MTEKAAVHEEELTFRNLLRPDSIILQTLRSFRCLLILLHQRQNPNPSSTASSCSGTRTLSAPSPTSLASASPPSPPNIDRVGDMQSDAVFILLVEKDAAYIPLAEDRFYNRFPCIIIVTAKGQPDVATRLFLRKMKMELKLPVLAPRGHRPLWIEDFVSLLWVRFEENMSYATTAPT